MIRIPLICTVILLLASCASPQSRCGSGGDSDSMRVNAVLTAWHLAASEGSFDIYFDAMTDDSVFLGTDASERWTKLEFMGYAREPFSDGNGWTYTQVESHIAFDDDRDTAWADEILRNEKYGILRGTSVLNKVDGEWKIAHYSLTFLVPNEKAASVVEVIAEE